MTNTNEKVTVTREVAEALATELSTRSADTIISIHAPGLGDLWKGTASVLNDLPLDTLIRALYIGYEIKRSPEEELADYIENFRMRAHGNPSGPDHDYFMGKVQGARKAAEILGVTLPKEARKK